MRRGDDHAVQRRRLQHVLISGKLRDFRARLDGIKLMLIPVADRDQLGMGQTQHMIDMHRTHIADADDADFHFVHGRVCVSSVDAKSHLMSTQGNDYSAAAPVDNLVA